MFIPATVEEVNALGWESLDIILITGDAYIDSSYIGVSVIGHVLINAGYKVAIIAQPDINSPADITRFGEPNLFWGVTSGAVDSMVSNYTASKKPRKQDDLTPGAENTKRPDRALVVYTGLIRRFFKNTKPIVIGGIEASLRRISHYDYWSDSIKRSVLFDSKADILVYGMGEKTILEIAESLKNGGNCNKIKGLCYITNTLLPETSQFIQLPPYEKCVENKKTFQDTFVTFYNNSDASSAKGLIQKHGDRFLIHNPPQDSLSTKELDLVYNLPYERDAHPYYKNMGEIRALDTIRFSITTHRGCYGECNFCAIAVHQGRKVVSRSEISIIKEAKEISTNPAFRGIIFDVGGPTANMYGIECEKKIKSGSCKNKRCLFPSPCESLKPNHKRQIELLQKIKELTRIKKAFVASGVRYDLVFADETNGELYLENLVANHISGQMKVAPEHSEDSVLKIMGKPSKKLLRRFRDVFIALNKKAGKNQFLTYYFIAAHPGCKYEDMVSLKNFASTELHHRPEQVQIFTPTPSTFSTLMYYTEINPFTGEKIFVEKDMAKKEGQKNVMKTESGFGFKGKEKFKVNSGGKKPYKP